MLSKSELTSTEEKTRPSRVKLVLSVLYLPFVFFLFSLPRLAGGSIELVAISMISQPSLIIFVFSFLLLPRMKKKAARILVNMILVIIFAWYLFHLSGEIFFRFIYKSSFNPFSDAKLIPPFLEMISGAGFWLSIEGKIVTALLTSLIFLFISILLTDPLRYLGQELTIKAGKALIVISIIMFTASLSVSRIMNLPDLEMQYLSEVFNTNRNGSAPATFFNIPLQETGNSKVDIDKATFAFGGIEDANVRLFIVESYGHTLFTNEEHRQRFRPMLDRIASSLSDGGWFSVSGFYRSPAYGGRSWLADATLLTGNRISNQDEYEEIIDSNKENLTDFFGNAGYTRILSAPGTQFADQRWKSFYSFDSYFLRNDFSYKGPFLNFGAMPDQYSIYKIHQQTEEITNPLFVSYILVTSHVPFNTVAQFEPDWTRMEDSGYYNSAPISKYNVSWLEGGEYHEGYTESIDYVLTSISSYLREFIKKPELVIVVGDHQPRLPISEYSATYSVPVHILSNDKKLLTGLQKYGFNPGFIPLKQNKHPGMEEFAPMLINHLQAIDKLPLEQ